ncbi:uncharacterized protein IUM83_19440 [Phytophthora cinnamomi]|uniref:uncharacterized protein n=1 Tax=Phytophthora cinnamomi TaxID=4785 RepID=UPI00355A6191|nr:hypothetical protein IUM83_19440 [Phytophthora cinnamomi]
MRVISASWRQYARTLVCTHHGKYKSKSTSKRSRQEIPAEGCSAQVSRSVGKSASRQVEMHSAFVSNGGTA